MNNRQEGSNSMAEQVQSPDTTPKESSIRILLPRNLQRCTCVAVPTKNICHRLPFWGRSDYCFGQWSLFSVKVINVILLCLGRAASPAGSGWALWRVSSRKNWRASTIIRSLQHRTNVAFQRLSGAGEHMGCIVVTHTARRKLSSALLQGTRF